MEPVNSVALIIPASTNGWTVTLSPDSPSQILHLWPGQRVIGTNCSGPRTGTLSPAQLSAAIARLPARRRKVPSGAPAVPQTSAPWRVSDAYASLSIFRLLSSVLALTIAGASHFRRSQPHSKRQPMRQHLGLSPDDNGFLLLLPGNPSGLVPST